MLLEYHQHNNEQESFKFFLKDGQVCFWGISIVWNISFRRRRVSNCLYIVPDPSGLDQFILHGLWWWWASLSYILILEQFTLIIVHTQLVWASSMDLHSFHSRDIQKTRVYLDLSIIVVYKGVRFQISMGTTLPKKRGNLEILFLSSAVGKK